MCPTDTCSGGRLLNQSNLHQKPAMIMMREMLAYRENTMRFGCIATLCVARRYTYRPIADEAY